MTAVFLATSDECMRPPWLEGGELRPDVSAVPPPGATIRICPGVMRQLTKEATSWVRRRKRRQAGRLPSFLRRAHGVGSAGQMVQYSRSDRQHLCAIPLRL